MTESFKDSPWTFVLVRVTTIGATHLGKNKSNSGWGLLIRWYEVHSIFHDQVRVQGVVIGTRDHSRDRI